MREHEDSDHCACRIPDGFLRRAAKARTSGRDGTVELMRRAKSALERRAVAVVALLDLNAALAEELLDVEHPDHWLLHCRERAERMEARNALWVEVDETNFGDEIVDEDRPVVALFYRGLGESPCDAVAENLRGRVKCVRIDAAHSPRIAALYKIPRPPAALLLRRGVVAARIDGLRPQDAVKHLLAKGL